MSKKYNYSPNSTTDNAYHMVNFKDYDYEIQRTNNFEFQITGLSNLVTAHKGKTIAGAQEVIRIACSGIGTPSASIEAIKVRRGNAEVKFAGQASFDDTEIKLNDFIGKDTEKVMNAWHALVYNPSTQNTGKASDYKRTAYVVEYSPDHKIIRQWELVGCWLSKVNYGDYSSEDVNKRQITGTIVYDYAINLDE